jgi:hypothetical protein
LICCAYDNLGDVCMLEESCGQTVPPTACGVDPSLCSAFPLAACCNVNGAPQCSLRQVCDQPFFICAQDTDCGASGAVCCTDTVDYLCGEFDEGCEDQ